MSFALGDTNSPPFSRTPYEHLLGIYRQSTGVDLIPIFDAIQADLGNMIDEATFVEELTRRARFIDHMEAILQGRPPHGDLERLAIYEATHYWFFFHHHIGGQRVFKIHSELAKALNDTDLRVPAAYLELPFEGLCLSYEGDVLRLEAPEVGVPGGALDAVYVTSFLGRMAKMQNLGQNPRRFCFYAKASGSSEEQFGLAFMGFLPTIGQGDELVDEAFINRSVPPEGASDPRMEVLKLALKTIAYINSSGADAVELPAPSAGIDERLRRVGPGKIAKLERRLGRLSHQPYIYVGAHLPKAHEAPVSIPERGVRKLTYAFMVRGHFHGFWKLKENIPPEGETSIRQEEIDDRGRTWVLILKWVHPYEKGPEEAEKIHRRYFVR